MALNAITENDMRGHIGKSVYATGRAKHYMLDTNISGVGYKEKPPKYEWFKRQREKNG